MEKVKVFIEILEGSNEKYELDENTKELKLNFVFQNLAFPFYYGFIPNTLGGDNDPLDAIVLSTQTLKQKEVVNCKVIGVFKTTDRGETDNKIICVPINDQLAEKYTDIAELPTDTLKKWTEFYLEVGRQKKKDVTNMSLAPKAEALEEIKNSFI